MQKVIDRFDGDKRLTLTFYLSCFGASVLFIFGTLSVITGNTPTGIALLCAMMLGLINLFVLFSGYRRYARRALALIVFLISISLIVFGGKAETGHLWTYPNIAIAIAVLSYKEGVWFSMFYMPIKAVLMLNSHNIPFSVEYEAMFTARYLASGIALAAICLVLVKAQEEVSALLQKRTVTDELTGLYNRGVVASKLNKANMRQPTGISYLLLLDIDHFKQINDKFGHDVGDKTLVLIANLLRKHVRDTDLVIRWGGEEFLIILRDASAEGAVKKAEQIRAAYEADEETIALLMRPASVSIGVSRLSEDEDLHTSLIKTDKNLYLAKQQGRNRVVASHLD
ncbi:GGDEF domain-containing protein [Glaciecola siphonariae]|uniref:diguanylate cyclase n=1 Tax=Glaciecola siphonariae TaxID=521012 RepID=A0ABV9LQW9_9ALTE